jgi:hypothetical protein
MRYEKVRGLFAAEGGWGSAAKGLGHRNDIRKHARQAAVCERLHRQRRTLVQEQGLALPRPAAGPAEPLEYRPDVVTTNLLV